MKRIVLTICVVCTLGCSLFAEPGDVLIGKNKALWRIATYKDTTPGSVFEDGVMAVILSNMESLPMSYVATADIQEWVSWTRIMLIQAFPTVVFPKEVYHALIYAIDYYHYGTPQIADNRASPSCVAGAGEITCDKDPLAAEGEDGRTPVLWRVNGGEYTEQNPDASGYTIELAGDTWTIGPLPAVDGLIVAYDDEFQSFPTFPMTVTAP